VHQVRRTRQDLHRLNSRLGVAKAAQAHENSIALVQRDLRSAWRNARSTATVSAPATAAGKRRQHQ
jgi:hypothetical protein